MMNRKTTLIAAVAVCSGTAFLVGRMSSKQEVSSADQPLNQAHGPRAAYGPDTNPHRGAPKGLWATSPSHSLDSGPSSNSTAFQDPITQMESIIGNPNALDRTEQWLQFVKGLNPAEIKDAVDIFRSKDLARKNLTEYSMLLNAWAKLDPYAAIDYAKENTGSSFARETILTSWATADPGSAIRWAESNYFGEGDNPWMVGVIRGIAASDPQLATKLLSKMSKSSQRNAVLDTLHLQYLNQGPESARNWATSIEDDELRADAMTRIADGLSRTDPKATADWLLANPGKGANQAISNVMAQMALTDARTAISYMDSISDPAIKSRALEGITSKLAAIDPYTSLATINANPDVVNDDIMRQLIWGARTSEPVLAANTIVRIEDKRIREQTYMRFVGLWVRSDAEGAANWVDQNELPQNLRQSLEAMIEQGKGRGPFANPGL